MNHGVEPAHIRRAHAQFIEKLEPEDDEEEGDSDRRQRRLRA